MGVFELNSNRTRQICIFDEKIVLKRDSVLRIIEDCSNHSYKGVINKPDDGATNGFII